jgi:hypothetical protein
VKRPLLTAVIGPPKRRRRIEEGCNLELTGVGDAFVPSARGMTREPGLEGSHPLGIICRRWTEARQHNGPFSADSEHIALKPRILRSVFDRKSRHLLQSAATVSYREVSEVGDPAGPSIVTAPRT